MNQTENALALAGSIGGKNGLNCIAELDGTALEQTKAQEADKQDKPLAGIPVLVKDNIDVKGLHRSADECRKRQYKGQNKPYRGPFRIDPFML